MEGLQKELKMIKSGQERDEHFEAVKKVLEKQTYPAEVEEYLKMVSRSEFPWNIVQAYHLGVIVGKKRERSRHQHIR